MRRNLLVFPFVLFCLVFSSCQKNENFIQRAKFQDPFVDGAIDYLKPQISNADFEKLDFKRVLLLKTGQATTGVIIHAKDRSDLRTIIIGKKNGVYNGNWLIKQYEGSTTTMGSIHTESFDNLKKTDVFFTDNKVIKFIQTTNGISKTFVTDQKKLQLDDHALNLRQMAAGDTSDTGLENYVWLPDVAVTLTLNDTGAFDNFYSLFWDFGADPIYYYQYSTEPDMYSGVGGTTLDADPYSPITFEFESGPGTDLSDLFRCFGKVSDAGASYSATLGSYIPDVTNPNILISYFTPGHTFITLTKSNNGISVSQSFGFYPQNGLKSLSDVAGTSKLVDDGNHEYNASITMSNISELDFNTVKNMAQNLANSMLYDLNDFNCTNYGLEVFNSIRPNNAVIVSKTFNVVLNIVDYGLTPNGLYLALKDMKNSNNGIQIGNFYAPSGSGGCN